MFRRRRDTLPTAAYSPNGKGNADGSGRGIRMEAPIVRSWRNSSGYIKGTYYSCFFNIAILILGYRTLIHSNASTWLTCNDLICTIQVTPFGNVGTTELEFPRSQIVKADAVKVDKDHVFQRLDSGVSYHNRKNKNIGPDGDGLYDSYVIVLRTPVDDEENDLTALEKFTYRDNEGNLVMPMRKYNLGRTRRRTKTMTVKVDTYVKRRRKSLVLKESAPLSWQGIVLLVLGIFLLLLTLLIGQFIEETKQPTIGPGARRADRRIQQNRRTIQSSRSKMPSGKRY